jgi:rod shape-determining protein MreC
MTKTKQILKTILVIGTTAGLLLAFNLTDLGNVARNAFLKVFPPWQIFFRPPNVDDRQEAEVALLRAQIAKLQKLESENQELRQALGLNLEKEFSLMMTDIAGKDPLTDAVFINKGGKDGLKPGLAIINAEKIFVGQIETVLENYSRVRLAADKQSSLAVLVQNKNGEVNALARGQGDWQINLELIPQEAKVMPGDLVVTAGSIDQIPQGLLFGQVAEIDSSDTQPFGSASLEPAFSPSSRKTLFVIIDF